jgi:VIT1/CCC1 family predicted Fe2+/Mn2+ transporter
MPSNESTPLTAMDGIRTAYNETDVEKSRAYHDARGGNGVAAEACASENGHQSSGGQLKPVIFGGLDGILTSFAIVAGAAGGRLSPQVVLILGFSNIVADALSMGVGEFLSSKAESEWILSERSREEWELDNYPQGEIQEMIEIYERRGVSKKDAEMVITTLAKYKSFFVDLMMTQELQLQVPEGDHVQESIREGFVMFCSFAFFGSLPLLGYVIIPAKFPHLSEDGLFRCACIITGCVLFLLGSVKSFFSSQLWYRAGMETLLLGGCCATVAFTLGQLVQQYLGDDVGEL